MPKATFDEDRGRAVCTRKVMQPLEMKKLPTSYSFGIFDGSVFPSLRMCLHDGLTRIHPL